MSNCGRVIYCAISNKTSCLKKHLGICKVYKVCILNHEGDGGSLKLSNVYEDVFREASNEILVMGELTLSCDESLVSRYSCIHVNLYKPHSWRTTTKDILEM